MTGEQIAVFVLTIAGYGTGWWARGGSLRRQAARIPAPDALPDDAREALAGTLAACRAALESPAGAAAVRLHEATRRAEAVDVALELRLGADDPRYRRFERMLNVLESVAHQAAPGIPEDGRLEELSSLLSGVAAELDAPRP